MLTSILVITGTVIVTYKDNQVVLVTMPNQEHDGGTE